MDVATFNAVVTRAMSEATWQAHVLQAARLAGWMAYHTYDSRLSQSGFPDLVLVKPPRVLFVELKTERGRIRPEQKEWLAALSECSQPETYLWRPSDRDVMLGILGLV